MVKKLLAFCCLSFLLATAQALTVKPRPQQEKNIEILFVIDTTGSMGGLIEGAKTKVWSIVNDVMQNQRSKAKVKIGLVAYRDRGDQYVTQVTPLNENLDEVYKVLMGFKAQGGGDLPEDVRMALRDAVKKGGWSKNTNETNQIIFLVGDAPPHDDYQDVPSTTETAKLARKQGMIINTIQCGNIPGTDIHWRNIAQYGGGEYFAIAQNGGTVAISTPYDKDLIRLNGDLGKTYLAYGASSKRTRATTELHEVEAKIVAEAPIVAQADRAVNKAINSYAYSSEDLIQGVENKTIDLKSIKNNELPENMQKMTLAQKEAYVNQLIKERGKLKDEILTLSKQRDAYIAKEKKNTGTVDSFDSAVSTTLKKQIK